MDVRTYACMRGPNCSIKQVKPGLHGDKNCLLFKRTFQGPFPVYFGSFEHLFVRVRNILACQIKAQRGQKYCPNGPKNIPLKSRGFFASCKSGLSFMQFKASLCLCRGIRLGHTVYPTMKTNQEIRHTVLFLPLPQSSFSVFFPLERLNRKRGDLLICLIHT